MNKFIKNKSRHLFFGGIYTLCNVSCFAADGDRPNIIYIMADDHAAQAISAYGGILKDVLPTPNLDRIANEGMRLHNCFVTNSISTPSRGAVITGQTTPGRSRPPD